MKKIVKYFGWILLFVAISIAGIYIGGQGYLIKGLWASYLHGYRSASIGDMRFFKTNPIATGEDRQPWPFSLVYPQKPSDSLMEMIEKTGTVAFMVIRHDSICMELYREQHTDSSLSNSFSMAKSITTLLTQMAIQKGLLKGWNQKVKELLPDLQGPFANELELWHLSTMSSGLDWDEHYHNPFSITAQAYYGSDIQSLMKELPIIHAPGKAFVYQSGSTQLLGLCVMQAAGKGLSELASEWLWKPLGAGDEARWHTDDRGTELAYCCFNATARDFARLGKLMLHRGRWEGEMLIDSSFVEMATKPALSEDYGYSFWLDNSHGTPVFYQRGILGQYIIVIPEYDGIIVRLGHERIPPREGQMHTDDFHRYVEEVLKMWR